ncbi:hypothetical protein, partial [Serratia marcescens]|uniref:hypothetical protein n=1 Tax=Serratia marcescens TaxID=615 RepID=UPI002812A390
CLADCMNEGITQSKGIGDRMLELADRAIREAKRIDGLETGTTRRGAVIAHSRWLSARNRSQYSER